MGELYVRYKMTRSELAFKIKQFERGNRKFEWPFLIFYIAGMVVVPLVIVGGFGGSDLSQVLGIVGLFVWIIIPGIFLKRLNKKRLKKLDLLCPHCSVGLSNYIGQLAVTTLYCSSCGNQVAEPNKSEQNAGARRPSL